jgi:hypothetical protein
MPTLLFQNVLPTPPLDDPTYLEGIANLSAAVQAGAKVYVTLTIDENGVKCVFYADIAALKVGYAPNTAGTLNYASGLLALRGPLNNYAQSIAGTYLVGGSVDTQGNYIYNPVTGDAPDVAPGYIISWWAA